MAERITKKEFKQIRAEFGNKAANKAFRQFIDPTGFTELKLEKDRDLTKAFGKVPGGTKTVGFKSDASFENVRQAAAVIQGRRAGVNEISDKKARVLAKSALRPKASQLVNESRSRLATQRLRAGRIGASEGFAGATAGLFAPAHLARQRLIRSSLFAGGIQ